MEALIHNDYRQQPITSDKAFGRYREHLARLETSIQDQEDVVFRARSAGDASQLAQARSARWRLLTKRQGVVDALADYEGDNR